MKKHITKTLSLALAALLLHPGMHSASSSSSSSAASSSYGMPEEDLQPNSLYEIMFKGLAGNEFFDALEKVDQEQPGLTNQQKVDAAIQNMEHFGDIFNPRFYLRDLARDEFFKQLKIIRRDQPEITYPRDIFDYPRDIFDVVGPRNIVDAAARKMPPVPLFEGDIKKQALFSIVSNYKPYKPLYGNFPGLAKNPLRNFLGLSIQDLIDHNLIPKIAIRGWGRELNLSNMHIDNLTGIQNIPGIETIRDLHLDKNKLQTIAPETFAVLPNLKALYLDSNHITDPVEINRIRAEWKALNPDRGISITDQTPAPSASSPSSSLANNTQSKKLPRVNPMDDLPDITSSSAPLRYYAEFEELPATTPFSWLNDDE